MNYFGYHMSNFMCLQLVLFGLLLEFAKHPCNYILMLKL